MNDVKKTCPVCAQPLVVRRNKTTGHEFLGCSEWPGCTHTEPLPTDALLRRRGAPTLPGL